MLKTRVITALVLVSLLLPSLFWLQQPEWALLVAAFVGIAAWAWGALLGWSSLARVSLGVVTAGLCALLSIIYPASLEFRIGHLWLAVAYGLSAAFCLLLLPP